VIEALLLAAAAVVAGGVGNAIRRDHLPLRLPATYYQVESGAKALLLAPAEEMFRGGKAIFLDARPVDAFEAGHIQGSFHVPVEEWTSLYEDLAPWIEGQPIVVYASPDQVSRADELARALASRGHARRLFVYVGGIEEWRGAGMPVDIGPAPPLDPEAEEGIEW
jgi:rhodanese-related sulfurtransferase